VAFVTALLAAAPAQATFPGTNGRIAFSQGFIFPPIGGEPGDTEAHSQVFTMGPTGNGLKQLTHVPPDRGAASPDWSPDGQRIVYQSNQTGSYQIWVMDANGANQTQLTDYSGFETFQPSWSPEGNHIVFSRCGEPTGFIAYCDVARIDAGGGGLVTLLHAGRWMNVKAAYSPDGQEIAFGSDKGGLQSAIWVMNADGTGPHRVTGPSLRAFWPDWSPSGDRILFVDNCCIPDSNLWTVGPDGSGLTELTDFVPGVEQGGFGGYSPNGRRIVMQNDRECRDSPCHDLYTMNALGGPLSRVVTGRADSNLFDWGPGN
jgi:Tol biopolymer transport system component